MGPRVTSFLSTQRMMARKLPSAYHPCAASWEWKEEMHRSITALGIQTTLIGANRARTPRYLWVLSPVTISVLILALYREPTTTPQQAEIISFYRRTSTP